MNCFGCEPPNEESDVLCDQCRAEIAAIEQAYAAEIELAGQRIWAALEPRLRALMAQPDWQEQAVVMSLQ